MTVMTRSTMTTANSMASQSTSGLETQQQQQQQQNLIVFAMKHTLLVKRTFEQEFPGETLPLADAFREVCSIVRQGYIMQYDDQREERRDRRTQQRHEETMAADREDPGWLDTIQSRRATMYEALMNEALKTLYLFFFLHVIWHFARFHQVWTFTGILTALKYSICGQCMLETAGIEWEDSSMLGYISSFFPSWTTVGSYMGLYWTCSTICILKAIFSVFWALLTAMIVPVWMVKYMAAAVIVLTMLSNVLELVPFVMSWGYLGISYFIVWTFCYVSIWSVCRQSQYTLRNSSSRGTTPSRDAVTGEVLLLSDLTDTFLLAHKFFLGEIVLCCIICSILELERNR